MSKFIYAAATLAMMSSVALANPADQEREPQTPLSEQQPVQDHDSQEPGQQSK